VAAAAGIRVKKVPGVLYRRYYLPDIHRVARESVEETGTARTGEEPRPGRPANSRRSGSHWPKLGPRSVAPATPERSCTRPRKEPAQHTQGSRPDDGLTAAAGSTPHPIAICVRSLEH